MRIVYTEYQTIFFHTFYIFRISPIIPDTSDHTHNYAKAILFGLFTSIGVEVLQLITRTGMCETDDVICNTLGCLIGAMVAYGCIRLFKWFKR